MLGLHPCSVKAGWEQELQTIWDAQQGRKIYAIGEIGIDLYWDKTTLPEQVAAFKAQIAYAKALKLSPEFTEKLLELLHAESIRRQTEIMNKGQDKPAEKLTHA